jgi:hypothetical protein
VLPLQLLIDAPWAAGSIGGVRHQLDESRINIDVRRLYSDVRFEVSLRSTRWASLAVRIASPGSLGARWST